MRSICYLVLSALMLLAALPAAAQENTLAPTLGGKTIPLSLTLKQLDGTWRCISPEPAADAAEALVRFIMVSEAHLPWAPEVMYTHGETLLVAGETYLVAYGRPAQPLPTPGHPDRGNGEEVKPAPTPLTPDTEVFLTLLDIHSMGNLLNIHPFDLQRVLAEGKNPPITPMNMKDEQIQSLNNLRQLTMATMMYAQDHGNVLPPMDTSAAWLAVLKVDARVTTQPGTGEPYQPNPALSNKPIAAFPDPAQAVLSYEQHPWPNGLRGVAFLDGHVQMLTEQQFQQMLAEVRVVK